MSDSDEQLQEHGGSLGGGSRPATPNNSKKTGGMSSPRISNNITGDDSCGISGESHEFH